LDRGDQPPTGSCLTLDKQITDDGTLHWIYRTANTN